MKKTLTTLAAIAVMAPVMIIAGDRTDQKIENAVENYKIALKSDNAGLRLSAMHQIAALKAEYPEINLERVGRDLRKISTRDDYPVLRFRAGLTYEFLKNDALYQNKEIVKRDADGFYALLHEKVNEVQYTTK